MSDSVSQELALFGDLSPKARAALWSIFWTSIALKENAKKVATREWDFVLRRLQIDFWEKGIDQYNPSIEVISTQYKPLFMEGQVADVIRLLQETMDRLSEAKRLSRMDMRTFFGAMDYLVRPKPYGNFARLLNNTFQEFHMPYYVDMRGQPIIVAISNPVEKETIEKALQILPQAGYAQANQHFRDAIKHLNKGDWKNSVQESLMCLESVAVTIKPEPKQTLGSAILVIKKEGKVHKELCNAITSVWKFANQVPGIRHGQAENSAPITDVGQNEGYLILTICARFAVYLVMAYR